MLIYFQGAFSTMIGISLLASIDAYIVQIFFKTIFLVITFSLIHGLVFLPVFLTIFLPHAKQQRISQPFFISKKEETLDKCNENSTKNKDISNFQFEHAQNFKPIEKKPLSTTEFVEINLSQTERPVLDHTKIEMVTTLAELPKRIMERNADCD